MVNSDLKPPPMCSNQLRIGYHVKLESTILETLTKYPTVTTQFYMGNKLSFNTRDVTSDDWNNTYNYCTTNNQTFYVHTSLLCNLAHSTKQYIVDGSMEVLQKQINTLTNLPAAAVLHVGNSGTISNIVANTNNLQIGTSSFGPTLLFENSAGEGTKLGKSFDELRLLFEGLDSTEGKIGLCLDTQHMYGAGMCKFDSYQSVVTMFEEAESVVGTGVTLFHLNDSKVQYASRVDRHQSISNGYIWGSGQLGSIEALDYLLCRCREDAIDIVGETGNPTNDLPIINSRLHYIDTRPKLVLTDDH